MIVSMAAGYLQRAAGAIIRTVAFNLNGLCGVREINCFPSTRRPEAGRINRLPDLIPNATEVGEFVGILDLTPRSFGRI